jgi:Flp pilus assembly protein TadG
MERKDKRSVLSGNSEMRNSRASQRLDPIAVCAIRLHERLARVSGKVAARVREVEGAELLEFAMVLPVILVMLIGLLDFSNAYNVKQKLATAAREGARTGASQPNYYDSSSPPSLPAIKDVVTSYLTTAGFDTSFINSTLTYDSTTHTGTYYTTGSTGTTYGLKIELFYHFADTSGTSILSTRVTLRYPYNWGFGFNKIIKLLVPSAGFGNPITIETDATMQNLNG